MSKISGFTMQTREADENADVELVAKMSSDGKGLTIQGSRVNNSFLCEVTVSLLLACRERSLLPRVMELYGSKVEEAGAEGDSLLTFSEAAGVYLEIEEERDSLKMQNDIQKTAIEELSKMVAGLQARLMEVQG